MLENNSPEMEKALTTVLNYSVAPVVLDETMDCAAYYDADRMELAVNPNYSDNEAFAAIAAEVAHSRFHAKGVNVHYSRAECELDAQSVSCILCRRFGVERDMPDLSHLGELYGGWAMPEVRQALDCVQKMSKNMVNSIEKNIAPPVHTRGGPVKRPER